MTQARRSRLETIAAQLIVLAKAPVPGRVKTRLTPPFTPQEAAMLAEAALTDTLEAGASASFAAAHAGPGRPAGRARAPCGRSCRPASR